MPDATDQGFAPEEVLSQAQGNATALFLAAIAFLKERGLDAGEYASFFGRRFAPGWEELRGRPLADIARMAALNAVSVGGQVREVSGEGSRAEVVVAGWPAEEFLDILRLTRDDAERVYDLFYPIMGHLGIRYEWRRGRRREDDLRNCEVR